jgi:hypothetical protein
MVKPRWDARAESLALEFPGRPIQNKDCIMASTKRKNLETQLQRRVRARRDSSEEFEDGFNDSASENVIHKEADGPPDQDAEDTSESGEEDIVVKFSPVDLPI